MKHNNKWFRFYERMIDSPQIVELDDAEFRLIVSLWVLASTQDEGGIIRYSAKGLATRLRFPCDILTTYLRHLCDLDLLSQEETYYIIPRWREHQYQYASHMPEKRAEQKRKERAQTTQSGVLGNGRKSSQECRKPVVKESQAKSKPDTDTDTESEKGGSGSARAHTREEPASPSSLKDAAAPPDFRQILKAKGYTQDEIAQALAIVHARPNPPASVTDWAKYLEPVLRERRGQNSNNGTRPAPSIPPDIQARLDALEKERAEWHEIVITAEEHEERHNASTNRERCAREIRAIRDQFLSQST